MRVDVEALDRISDEFVHAALEPVQWKGLIERLSAAQRRLWREHRPDPGPPA